MIKVVKWTSNANLEMMEENTQEFRVIQKSFAMVTKGMASFERNVSW